MISLQTPSGFWRTWKKLPWVHENKIIKSESAWIWDDLRMTTISLGNHLHWQYVFFKLSQLLRSLVEEDPSNKEAFVWQVDVRLTPEKWHHPKKQLGNNKHSLEKQRLDQVLKVFWFHYHLLMMRPLKKTLHAVGIKDTSQDSTVIKKVTSTRTFAPTNSCWNARLSISLRVVRKKWPKKCKRRHGPELKINHQCSVPNMEICVFDVSSCNNYGDMLQE